MFHALSTCSERGEGLPRRAAERESTLKPVKKHCVRVRSAPSDGCSHDWVSIVSLATSVVSCRHGRCCPAGRSKCARSILFG